MLRLKSSADDLLLEAGGTVIASEATLLFVKTQAIYRGIVTGLETATFTYTGNLPFVIEAPLSTHLRAPNAEVIVRRDFTGQIVARVITVDAGWKVFCN